MQSVHSWYVVLIFETKISLGLESVNLAKHIELKRAKYGALKSALLKLLHLVTVIYSEHLVCVCFGFFMAHI